MESFEIIKELGSGSFGKVYKAKRRQGNQIVAIKQIKMTALNQKQKDCALNQIRLLASISSPNVVTYHSAFFDHQTSNLCIVMEYADGGDLNGLIENKKQGNKYFNENFIWKVAFDLLRALKILHSNKILHRDIKPGNVFLSSGVAKLGDLNISKVMQGNFATTHAGTPFYTSPEIWNGQFYDSKCDIWSLGCLLYEITALKPPFQANSYPLLSKQVNSGYFDPIPPIYSKRLSDIIKACLRVNMHERPSAVQMLMDSVFQYMKTTEQGSVNLLTTIRCPKILSLIQQKLPDSKSQYKNIQYTQYQNEQRNHIMLQPQQKIQIISLSERFKQSIQLKKQERQSLFKDKQNQRLHTVRQQNQSPQTRELVYRLQSPQPYRNRPDEPVRMKSPTIYRRIM